MGEFFNEYLDIILTISGTLVVILGMLNKLKTQVQGLVNKAKDDYSNLQAQLKVEHDNNITLKKGIEKLLEYVEMESELKQLSKIVPQDTKDKYSDLKLSALEVHEEIKKLV